ncbi:MAG: 2,3-diphosphoglycerate-dependent phosphoglycerate mutase [Selenomonadaceae bacterium]
MKLVLIRHGESDWNRKNLFTGWTDVELTEKGENEGRTAGRLLRENGFDFDLCYTSYLKRAIHTLQFVLQQMDRDWLPVVKDWKLNERHYGALQGLNKAETAAKYGEEQVLIWRRSFDVRPPLLEETDDRNPKLVPQYREIEKNKLPLGESLADTIERVLPYYEQVILPQMQQGKRILIAAHGNSLRALVMKLEGLSEEEIMEVNIPTGVPLIYELDEVGVVTKKYYLGDEEAVKAAMAKVASQGKAKKEG